MERMVRVMTLLMLEKPTANEPLTTCLFESGAEDTANGLIPLETGIRRSEVVGTSPSALDANQTQAPLTGEHLLYLSRAMLAALYREFVSQLFTKTCHV